MANFDIGDGEDNPKRFASLEASDLDKLLEAAHSKRTKYSTNFALCLQRLVHLNFNFKFTTVAAHQVFIYYVCLPEWALQRNISQELHEQSDEELDRN